MRKQLILPTFAAVIVFFAVFVIFGQRGQSSQLLIVESEPHNLVMLVEKTVDDEHDDSNNQPINIRSGSKVQLEKGRYHLRSAATADHEAHIVGFALDNEPVRITFRPPYSSQKLQTLLASEQDSINSTLKNSYPEQMTLMQLKGGALHARGEWYSGILTPNEPGRFDTYRVVLKKDGSWKIASKPPAPVLSKHIYQDIPEEVLRSVNNRAP